MTAPHTYTTHDTTLMNAVEFLFICIEKVQDNKYVAMIACIYLLFYIALHSDVTTLVTSTTSGETQCTICKRLHHQETGIHGRRPMARCSCFSLLWCSLLFQFAVVLSSCFSLLRCFLLFPIPVPAPPLPSLTALQPPSEQPPRDRIAGRVRGPYLKNTTIVKINLPDTG